MHVAGVVIDAVGAILLRPLIFAVPQHVGIGGFEDEHSPAVVNVQVDAFHKVVGEGSEQIISVRGEHIGQAVLAAFIYIDADAAALIALIPSGIDGGNGITTDN